MSVSSMSVHSAFSTVSNDYVKKPWMSRQCRYIDYLSLCCLHKAFSSCCSWSASIKAYRKHMQINRVLTMFSTKCGLLILICFTVWYTSTSWSILILSNTRLHAQNKPLLLAPFLEKKDTTSIVKKSIWREFWDNFLNFKFSRKKVCCGYSLEVPLQRISNEYPQCVFMEKKKRKLVPEWSPNTLP